MSPTDVGFIGLAVLFVFLALGLPIGTSMALIGIAGFWYLVSGAAAISNAALISFQIVSDYSFAVLPLFLLMAHVCFVSGLGQDLYGLAAKWLGHMRGGLAMATVGGCAAFAAISASSVATAATMGLVSLPEMKRYKYDPGLATGAVASGGSMGVLIPPSGVLIVYGIITAQSIGKLFIAGIIPGILEAVFYILTIFILCRLNPALGPRGPQYTFTQKVKALSTTGEVLVLVILVLGGLIIGWFTPNEAGAVGAFGAIVITLIRKRLNRQKLGQALLETMKTAGMIYGILIGALIFNYFLAVTNMPTRLAEIISALSIPPLGIMGLIILVYIVLGCFFDAMGMVLLTIPILFPLVTSLGFDPIWFGIIIVRVMEMAMITPPIGMNVYIISGVAPDVPLSTIFKGIIPFLIADICEVALLLFIPQVVLYLPGIMQ
jgi:C4-dicarboxylate transporter, DctM subunit